jgi:hypothetical protein
MNRLKPESWPMLGKTQADSRASISWTGTSFLPETVLSSLTSGQPTPLARTLADQTYLHFITISGGIPGSDS